MSPYKLIISGKIWAAIGERTLFFRLSKRRLGGYYVYHMNDTVRRIGFIKQKVFVPESDCTVAANYFPFIWRHRHQPPEGLRIENRQFGMSRNCKSLYKKALSHTVWNSGGGRYTVASGSSGKDYLVRELANGGFACICEWAKHRKTWIRPCSHCLAIELYLERAAGRTLHLFPTKEDARRQKQQYRRLGLGVMGVSRG
jgi:hypothetical protein